MSSQFLVLNGMCIYKLPSAAECAIWYDTNWAATVCLLSVALSDITR